MTTPLYREHAAPGTAADHNAGGSTDEADPVAASSWFTPNRLLCLFCAMNLFIFLDRGMIASNGVNGASATPDHPASGIQGDFKLSLFQDGLLPAAFMVGLLVSSPIFAEASKHHNAFRLIGIGLSVWTAAVAGSGLSPGFVPLLLCRMAVGVGEASFVALAAPFIDDNAPPSKKSLWLSLFFMFVPLGFACGFIYGGIVGSALGWRVAFLILAAAMLPFAIFCLRAPAIDLRGSKGSSSSRTHQHHHQQQEQQKHAGGSRAHSSSVLIANSSSHSSGSRPLQRLLAGFRAAAADLKVLARHPVYIWNMAGMTVYVAAVGTFSFFGAKAARELFSLDPEQADLAFGAITVATGILGSLAGGALLDALGNSMRNAVVVCLFGVTLGAGLAVLSFAVAGSFTVFISIFACAELALFQLQAPANALCMWSVPQHLRPFALSVSVVTVHVLGDVPMPPLLGALQGHLQNWRLSMSLLSGVIFLSSLAYAAAAIAARTGTDYRQVTEEEEEDEEGLGPRDQAGRGSSSSRAGGEVLLTQARVSLPPLDSSIEDGGGWDGWEDRNGGPGDGSSRKTQADQPLLPSAMARSS